MRTRCIHSIYTPIIARDMQAGLQVVTSRQSAVDDSIVST